MSILTLSLMRRETGREGEAVDCKGTSAEKKIPQQQRQQRGAPSYIFRGERYIILHIQLSSRTRLPDNISTTILTTNTITESG